MPPRVRPTVPYSGTLPHREHRSTRSREPEHKRARGSRAMKRERLAVVLEDEIEEEIREAKNADQ